MLIAFSYLLFGFAGFLMLMLFRDSKKGFSWQAYIIVTVPWIFGAVVLSFMISSTVIYIFIFGSIIGTIFEWILAFCYYKVMRESFWVYKRFMLPGGHTSWLVSPMWGYGFLFAFLFMKYFV